MAQADQGHKTHYQTLEEVCVCFHSSFLQLCQMSQVQKHCLLAPAAETESVVPFSSVKVYKKCSFWLRMHLDNLTFQQQSYHCLATHSSSSLVSR